MGSNFKVRKGFLDLLLNELDTYLMVENGKKMLYLHISLILQTLFLEARIDLISQRCIFLEKMICLFQAAVATFA